jgi:hypothetical protein
MKTQSARVVALLAVAAALTLFAFVIATPSLRHTQTGLTARAGVTLPLDDEQAQQDEQQAIDNQVEEQQEADQQNAAAQAQMQLDEELASSP